MQQMHQYQICYFMLLTTPKNYDLKMKLQNGKFTQE